MAQGTRGKICLYEDFVGQDDPVAGTAVPRQLGMFRVVGQGVAEVDSGAPRLAGSKGVRLTTTNEDNHTAGIETNVFFSADNMGPLRMEAAVQFENLDTKEAFIGFTDIAIASDVPSIETDLMTGSGTTLTLTASDLVGFFLSAELTDDEDWHGVYNGGSTSGQTDATAVDLDSDAVAGEWQILALEIDPDGTVRWYVDEQLKQTVSGAVSTSTAMKFFAAVEAKSAANETMDMKLLDMECFEDWTV